jgi:hypothetical protein
MTDQGQPAAESAAQEAPKKGRKGFGINFKVSAKGAVSVYGLGRFPVTLYREQWLRLLEKTDDLKKFMDEHADDLKSKGEAQGEETPATQPTAGPTAIESVGDLAGEPGTTPSGAASVERAVTDDDAGAATASSSDDGPSDDPDLPPDDYRG